MGTYHHWNKYAVLERIAKDPNMTARQAAEIYDVARHTVERWCREAGISLAGHKHPRVWHILRTKTKRRKRLTEELARITREIEALEQQDPDAPYIKPKGSKR